MSEFVGKSFEKIFFGIDKIKKRKYNLKELYNFSNINFFLKN